MNLDYDPNAMFPKKRERKEEKFLTRERVVRFLVIAGLALFVLFIGAGCQNIKSLEVDFGGLDVEYFPAHPSQEEKSIFDFGSKTEDLVVPANWRGPLLMPLTRDK